MRLYKRTKNFSAAMLFVTILLMANLASTTNACPDPPCGDCYVWNGEACDWVGCDPACGDCEECKADCSGCDPICEDPVAEFDVTGYTDTEDIVVVAGTSLTFDASDSNDPDDTTLHYGWDFGDGGTDAGESVTYTFTEGGEWTIELVVLDSDSTECNEECPDHYDDATRTINVIEVEKVVKAGTSDEGPIVVGVGTTVDLEAIPYPGSTFPDEEPGWEITSRPAGYPVPGWVYGFDEIAALGGLRIPGDYVVKATCGTSDDSITVKVFEVTEIRFRHPSVWKTVDEDYKFLGVYTNDTVTFGVVTEPPGITLPDGSLTWGGDASGDGEEVSVTFTPEGSHTVNVSPSYAVVMK